MILHIPKFGWICSTEMDYRIRKFVRVFASQTNKSKVIRDMLDHVLQDEDVQFYWTLIGY